MTVEEMRAKFRELIAQGTVIVEKASKEGRDFTADERSQLQKFRSEAVDLKGKIDAAEADAGLAQQIIDLGAGLEEPKSGGGQGGAPAQPGRGKTLGEQFVGSPMYQAWMKEVAPGGHIPDRTKIASPPVEFKTLLTGESATSAGALVETDRTGIYEPLGRRPLTVRDLVSQRTTGSDLVEFVRQTAQVTQATVVGEATATAGTSGTKPEGAMAFEVVQTPVKTIAVWVPATRRALADASQLRGLIDSELREDLEEHLEDQIVAGAGSATDGQDFVGILNTSGVLTQAWETDLLTTARKAVTAIRVTGKARPTAWLVNPNDAETIDLLQDGENRYYYGGPMEGGVQRLWRYPVVECEAVTEGTGILGDWRKIVVWDREQASISVSDSHSDFFIRNMVAVLGEMRAAMGVVRPSAFIKVALAPST